MENEEKGLDPAALDELAGLKREMGPFCAEIKKEDLSIELKASSGWIVNIPPLTETWAIWAELLKTWDESAQRVVNYIVKGVIFPCVMRLTDIDNEYIADILTAHERLTERRLAAENAAGDESSGDAAEGAE